MGWVSYREDIDEKLEASRELELLIQDPVSYDPLAEARLRGAILKLCQVRSDIVALLELATDPSCDVADELLRTRRMLNEQRTRANDLEAQVCSQTSTIRELKREGTKLAGRISRLTEQVEGLSGKNFAAILEAHLTAEQLARDKPNP